MPKEKEITSQTMDEVVAIFKDTDSIKETALRMEMSQVKVRKILITKGLWSSPRSDEIKKLLDDGKTVKEVALALGITPVTVQAYMPYTKAVYGEPDRSDDAIRAEKYRERQAEFAVKQPGIERTQTETINVNPPKLPNFGEENKMAKSEMSKTADNIETSTDTFLRFPYPVYSPMPYEGAKYHEGDVYRLKLELVGSNKKNLPAEEWKILHKYGKAEESISREILVSCHSTLHAFHFMIQMLFGWQHSHLHEFELTDEDLKKLLSYNNTPALNYLDACGVYFRFPFRDFDDDDWDDDYEEGMSGKTWMRSKYKYPHGYPGVSDCWKENQRQVAMYREGLKNKYGVADDGTELVYIEPSYEERLEEKVTGKKAKGKTVSLKECAQDEFFHSIHSMNNPSALREHLHLEDIFTPGLSEVVSAADSKGKVVYRPKVTQKFVGAFSCLVGLERDNELSNIWTIIHELSKDEPEEAEEYKKDVEKFQHFMTGSEQLERQHYEKYGQLLPEEWQPAGFQEALYHFQRHFMYGPFSEMDGHTGSGISPLTDTLIYHYDFGDSWRVRITVEDVYSFDDDWDYESGPIEDADLRERVRRQVQNNRLVDNRELFYNKDRQYIDGELFNQVAGVYRSGKPLCIKKDGLDVLDDVGGVDGYVSFLQELHEGDKETRAENKEWARGQGWTGRDRKPEKML